MTVRLGILGPLRVRRGDDEVDAGPPQQRLLLAVLLARAGHPVSMGELVELLWGLASPPTAANVIQKYVGGLRRVLEPGLAPRAQGAYVARHGNGYRFTAGPETLDLLLFRRLVAEAKALAGRGEPDEALDRYVAALRLGQGPAGEGLADTPAARARFASLDGEFLDAVLAAVEVAGRVGRHAPLVAPLRRAAVLDPLNELVQAHLVTTLAAAGQRAEALAAYRSIRDRLADELGIDPGPDLRGAYGRVVARTVAPVDAGPSTRLPPDLPSFTGRTAELAMLDRLAGGVSPGGGPLVIALDGPGASALAVRYAHLVADDFAGAQLYVDLRAGGAPDAQYRGVTAGKRILLLLDHARDAVQVRPLLPSHPGSLVLVTSGRPLFDLAARDGAHLLHVERADIRGPRARRPAYRDGCRS